MALVITLLILPFVLTRLATPRFAALLLAGGAVRKNFAGKMIPTAAGISMVAAIVITYLITEIVWRIQPLELFSAVVVVLGMGMLGLIDDLLGTRDTTGIKGHLSMLLKGKLTTGGLKALGGGGLALAFSLLTGNNNIIDIGINTMVIALFTNAINLADLRPGRAGKVFLFGAFFLLVAGLVPSTSPNYLLLLPATSAVISFLPYDLQGQVMMGDTGSNVLGVTLGFVSVLLLGLTSRCILLGLLVLLHFYTEKRSLTETIERVRILRCIDEWGRP